MSVELMDVRTHVEYTSVLEAVRPRLEPAALSSPTVHALWKQLDLQHRRTFAAVLPPTDTPQHVADDETPSVDAPHGAPVTLICAQDPLSDFFPGVSPALAPQLPAERPRVHPWRLGLGKRR